MVDYVRMRVYLCISTVDHQKEFRLDEKFGSGDYPDRQHIERSLVLYSSCFTTKDLNLPSHDVPAWPWSAALGALRKSTAILISSSDDIGPAGQASEGGR